MAQIKTKFVTDNAINDLKARLRNNNHLRARNAADSGDVSIVKVTAADVIEFPTFPQVSGTPSNANDLSNKSYVDTAIASAVNGSDFKASVRAATTANITLSAPQTIDGVSVIAGDRVLVKNQTLGENNGIYVVAAGAWTRALDADSSAEVTAGMVVFVEEGTANADSEWELSTNNPIVLGTDPLVFALASVSPAIAGDGLSYSSGVLSVNSNYESLTLNGTDITNQYKDLAFEAINASVQLSVDGVMQYQTDDYTLSVVSSVTRITFAGDLATGGGAALIAGDKLRVYYIYK